MWLKIQELKSIFRNFGMEYFHRYYGRYRGIVVDNEDPDGLYKLSVQIPNITGKDALGTWALPCGLSIGEEKGLIAVPKKGETVWITFENGSIQSPIWEWAFWAKSAPFSGDINLVGIVDHYKNYWKLYEAGIELGVLDKEKIKLLEKVVEIYGNEKTMAIAEDTIEGLNQLKNAIDNLESAISIFATAQATVSQGPLQVYVPGFTALKTSVDVLKKALSSIKFDEVKSKKVKVGG